MDNKQVQTKEQRDREKKIKFDKALLFLATTMRVKLEPAQLMGYWSLLHDLRYEAFIFGLREAGKACRFFPQPAEIRTYAKDYKAYNPIPTLPEGGIEMPPEFKAKLNKLFGRLRPSEK